MPTPSEQLLSRTIYDVDGTTTVWNFAFSGGYIDPSHVKAYTELPTGARTPIVVTPEMLIGEFQLQISPALPPSAGVLVIYRDTPKDLPLVDFVEGPLSEIALDTNAKQAVFIAAETIDLVNATDVSAAIGAAEAAAASEAIALVQSAIATAAASAATTQAGIATAGGNTASTALADALLIYGSIVAVQNAAAAAGASADAALDSKNAAGVSAVAAQNAATTAANDAVAAIPVSSFMRTLLDDTTEAAARTTLGLPNSGPLSGLRNLIINGNFAINQRGYVSGAAVGPANTYTLDRWRVVTSGQSLTSTVSGNGRTVTAPSGGIEQVIEGTSIAGGSYVINWTGTATCTVNGIARAKGATFTLTANANATVRFSGGTVGEAQVEPGTVVTPFEARPIGLEEVLCWRYYQSGEFINSVGSQSGIQYYVTYPLRVAMRSAPTVTITAAPGLFANGAILTVSNSAQDNSSAVGLGFAFTTTSQPTNSVRILGGSFNASAEL